jgi:uncharacterized membrane-anchored protein
MKIQKYLFLFFIGFFLNPSLTYAVDEKKIENSDERYELNSTLDWKNLDNSKEHTLKIPSANLSIDILKSEFYLDNWKDINQHRWWNFGEGATSNQVAMIIGDEHTIYSYWNDDGYIKIDDWKDVNPDNLLKGMMEEQKGFREYLEKNNLNYVANLEWVFEPTLDKKNDVVNYSYKVTWSDGSLSLESKSLKLGKKGHLESAYVVMIDSNSDLKAYADASAEFAEFVSFNDDYRHSDYKAGDKVAAMGIGGLVAGSLGVKALAKAGILAKFMPFLLKFGWILLAPLFFIGKLFGGNKSEPKSSNRKKSK